MTWQYTSYLLPLLTIVIFSVVIGVLFLRRRRLATNIGALMMFAGAEWVLTIALELHAVDLGAKVFWNQLQYVGITTLLSALTMMTLLVMGDYSWVRQGKWAYWVIPPVLGTALVFTNHLHEWIWIDHEVRIVDGIVLLFHAHGFAYYLFYVYGFLVFTWSIALGLRMLGSRVHFYRRQALLLLAALGIPYIVALLELALGHTLLPYLSVMPIAFVIGALFYALAVLYLRAGDLVPVARDVVVDSFNVVLIVLDLQGRIADCNVAAQQLIGHSVQGCLGRPLTELWPEGAQVLLPLVANSTDEASVEDVVIAIGSEVHHFGVRVQSIDDWRGITGMQVILLHDITERKQSEMALRQSEARFRLLAESMPDNILLVDMNQRAVVYTNRPAFMGARIQGEFRSIDRLYRCVHPDDRPRVLDTFSRFVAGELGASFSHEYRIIPPSGEVEMAWVQDRETVLSYNDDGLPHEILVALTDITARKQADSQRLDVTLNQEKVRLLADFVHSVAHEFRTPLAVINTQLYLLERRHLAAETPEELALVKKHLAYIHKLLDDMLAMMRLDSETAPLVETFDLNALLHRIYDQFAPRCLDRDLTLSLQLAPGLPLCSLPVEFPRAIENVVDNAIVYTEPGGTIALATQLEDAAVVVEVKDTGIGIAPDDMSHIFERFYRVDQARTARQVGLGLPMTQRIVEMAGGHMTVRSVAGEGSTFTIHLPLVTDAEVLRQ